MENELDKLRKMLDDSGIPYENHKEVWPKSYENLIRVIWPADKYARNQIIYGRSEYGWKLDAICQKGSYGSEKGLIEIYGELALNDPYPTTAEEAFAIIKADFEKNRHSSAKGVE